MLLFAMILGFVDGLCKLQHKNCSHKTSKNLVDFLFFNYE